MGSGSEGRTKREASTEPCPNRTQRAHLGVHPKLVGPCTRRPNGTWPPLCRLARGSRATALAALALAASPAPACAPRLEAPRGSGAADDGARDRMGWLAVIRAVAMDLDDT